VSRDISEFMKLGAGIRSLGWRIPHQRRQGSPKSSRESRRYTKISSRIEKVTPRSRRQRQHRIDRLPSREARSFWRRPIAQQRASEPAPSSDRARASGASSEHQIDGWPSIASKSIGRSRRANRPKSFPVGKLAMRMATRSRRRVVPSFSRLQQDLENRAFILPAVSTAAAPQFLQRLLLLLTFNARESPRVDQIGIVWGVPR